MVPGYVTLSEITPYLYVGARPRTAESLNRAGFAMVVFCAEEYQPRFSTFQGVVVRVPMLDDEEAEPPSIALRKACRASFRVAHVLGRHGKVLCSCNWGFNRSALVAGLALVRMGYDADSVIARLRQKRGFDPVQQTGALSNRSYERAVRMGCR